MTRETKIGLLVGLAFIIVVAILLSDPVNNSSEPPAPIADTANNVRQSLTTPVPPAGQGNANTVVTPNRTPSHDQILTPNEAANQVAQVEVHGPANSQTLIIPPQAPGNDSQVSNRQSRTGSGSDAVVTPPTPPAPPVTPTDDPRQQVAQANGETLIPVDPHGSVTPGGDPATPPAPPVDSARQHYTAQAGDSVSKMAARLMGANTKANRAAIVAANPSLKKDPDRVIVGEVYVIPGAAIVPAAPPAAPPVAPDAGDQPATPPQVAQTPTPQRQPTRWYVVKPNDNLWRIATDEVGDSGAVAEIISLNKDILKGGSTLHPNMRLRLPPKTVASAD